MSPPAAQTVLLAVLAAAVLVVLAAPAQGYPLQLRAARRSARSVRSPTYYPDMYVPLRSPATSYLYPDDYPEEDEDYGQEQWFDVAASDPAANAAFLQNLMEANKYGERLERLGFPAGVPPYPARYVDPRYRDSDDYVFGSVNSGTTTGAGAARGEYERPAVPAAYGRYQYHVDQQDEDEDERQLHALAKKSRSDEQRLQDLEGQAQAEAQALLAMALGRQREEQARREANQRAEEFTGDANVLADLDQGLERLFAKSGITNVYRDQDEPKPWNGRDPVWNVSGRRGLQQQQPQQQQQYSSVFRSNAHIAPATRQGYYMGNAAEDTMPQRPTRSQGAAQQPLQAPATVDAPVPATRAPSAASSTRHAAAPTAVPATTSTTTTTTSAPTPAPMKRMLSAGQMSGQPEVALLRPATPRAGPRAAQRVQRAHQGGVDEIRSLLRVQDTMGARAHSDLLSLLPSISKRSAPVVSDEGSLVDELNALKKKSD
ncbi:uncharacterized protein LOC113204196 isoform X1 [Frankliniella occidentalis]|uniref:Uncharacterized protein LOC113204196 isoform X1 n=1 Tax=Frankliniella occidentalis TaxID=133901 RepID=A0A9C6WQV6_FRAOC|nr:uncharacterized protein LOC113204196 isoform X1 [Frankliniella occidentalis]